MKRINYRMIPAEKNGYSPGMHLVQYYDRNAKVWFDVGDPLPKAEAQARLNQKRAEQRFKDAGLPYKFGEGALDDDLYAELRALRTSRPTPDRPGSVTVFAGTNVGWFYGFARVGVHDSPMVKTREEVEEWAGKISRMRGVSDVIVIWETQSTWSTRPR